MASVLHSLALVLGVATLVLALAVGLGAARAAHSAVQGFQPDDVVITATAPASSGAELALPTQSLTPNDAIALGERGFVTDGQAAAPFAGLRTSVATLARSLSTDVVGSNAQFDTVRGYAIATGRPITAADVAAAKPVLVVGQTVVRQLFNGDSPVGKNVVIGSRTFQVVGVFARRGFSGSFDQDNLVVSPITAMWSELLGNRTVIDEIVIQASSVTRAPAVKAEATAALLQRHKFTNPAQADFQVRTAKDLAAASQAAARAAKRALGLASAALLLGAVIHMAIVLRARPMTVVTFVPIDRDRNGDALARLTRALTRAAIATIVGLALAVAGAGIAQRALGGVPALRFRPSAVVLAAGAGLLVAVAAWLVDLAGAGEGRVA